MTKLEQRRREVRMEAERRGLTIEPTGPRAWRVHGVGVDLLVADLASVSPENLAPYQPQKGEA